MKPKIKDSMLAALLELFEGGATIPFVAELLEDLAELR